jgi:hypothetical protein
LSGRGEQALYLVSQKETQSLSVDQERTDWPGERRECARPSARTPLPSHWLNGRVPCSADFKGTHALLGEDSAVLAVAELERRLDELGDAGDASVLLLVRAVPSLADELGLGLCEARGLTDALHTPRSPLLQTSQNLLEADLRWGREFGYSQP